MRLFVIVVHLAVGAAFVVGDSRLLVSAIPARGR
jgi:hypothetical protein